MKKPVEVKKRRGQHDDETSMEYLRRAVSNLDYEPGSILDDLTSVEALLDYFDLWAIYDTDFLSGIEEQIADGADATPLRNFVKQYALDWDVDAITVSA